MTQITGPNDGVLLVDSSAARSTGWALVSDLAQLAKPRITVMVAVTVYLGFQMAASAASGEGAAAASASGRWSAMLAALVGTALACMGASALNQVMERDTDARMRRTRQRPVPAGRVAPGSAVVFGLTLCVAGLTLLAALTTPLATALAAFTVASYALLYTPMKRRSSVSTIIGAAPGALPPVIGYAAATGDLGPAAWVMFAIMFMWQLPHFLAIAWLYRDDYARAGLPMLPVLDPDGGSTFRQILLGCLALLPLGLMPTMLGVSGVVYFAAALVAGLAFLACAVVLVLRPTAANARRLFYASLVYLPVVLTVMLVDRV